MNEHWLPIPGMEGRYDVSDQGRVRSWAINRGQPGPRIRRSFRDRDGYPQIRLSRNGVQFKRRIHVLVALAFLGPRPPGMETRHLDGDKLNNARTNLAYGTQSENALDSIHHGTHAQSAKTHCPRGHLYEEANTYVTPSTGNRHCRACERVREQGRVRPPRGAAKGGPA